MLEPEVSETLIVNIKEIHNISNLLMKKLEKISNLIKNKLKILFSYEYLALIMYLKMEHWRSLFRVRTGVALTFSPVCLLRVRQSPAFRFNQVQN